jgi:hypothetical protein
MTRSPQPTVHRRLAVHLGVLAVGAAVLRVAVVPAEVCPAVDAPAVVVAAEGAIDWIVAGQDTTGRYTYGYHRGDDRINPGYNEARHGGVTMSLYQAYAVLGDEDALRAADAGVGYAVRDLYDQGTWVAWSPGGNVPVGANALLLAGLAVRRSATGDPQHDELMRGIGRFLVAQQQADGSIFDSWSPVTGAAVPTYGLYSTGEASWALALLEAEFPGEGWGEAAVRTLDYMATRRDRVEGRLTRLPDHWAAYTVAALPPTMLNDLRLDYTRDLAGYFGMRLRFEAQRRGDGINLALRWFPGPPAGVGTAAEGIGALLPLVAADPALSDLAANVEERIVCTAGFMLQRQETADTAAAWPRPRLVEGAWFYRGYTQMDDQQHVLSGLLAAIPVLIEEESG